MIDENNAVDDPLDDADPFKALSPLNLHKRLVEAEAQIAALIANAYDLYTKLGHIGVPEPQIPTTGVSNDR